MKKLNLIVLALLTVFAILLTSCNSTAGFVPAPPPVEAQDVMNIQQLKIQDEAQLMNITSPIIDVTYRENGDGVGGTATEIITLPNGSKGTMLSLNWGSWDKADLSLINYYDSNGDLVSGMIEARFDELSLFQLLTRSGRYTLDRSSVTLVYEKNAQGELVLRQMQYAEKWGPGSKELAYGGYAVWTSRFEELLPASYQNWGFWEKNGTPADQVKDVMSAAMSAANRGVQPEFKVVDEDSGREVIGRQTGLNIYTAGEYYLGRCDFTYSNTWGRQPNTVLIGSGALSRISCYIGTQSYHIVVLSPKISPIGSALYVFTTDEKTAIALETRANSDNPSRLYDPLRNGEYEGVFLVTYGIGDIGAMSQYTDDGSVYIGDSGGVQWRTLGKVKYDNVVLASNLLALLGPAQYQTGLYYAYQPGSGSGLSYYLAALRLMYAPKDSVFSTFGQDVGVLDRVLVPDLSIFDIK